MISGLLLLNIISKKGEQKMAEIKKTFLPQLRAHPVYAQLVHGGKPVGMHPGPPGREPAVYRGAQSGPKTSGHAGDRGAHHICGLHQPSPAGQIRFELDRRLLVRGSSVAR